MKMLSQEIILSKLVSSNFVMGSPLIMAIILYFISTTVLGTSKSLKRKLVKYSKKGLIALAVYYGILFGTKFLVSQGIVSNLPVNTFTYLSYALMIYLAVLGFKFVASTQYQLRVLWALVPLAIILIEKLLS